MFSSACCSVACSFARKIAKLISVNSSLDEVEKRRTYVVVGQLFFVSTEDFLQRFDFGEQLDGVVLDLTHAHLWDGTAVDAIDKIVLKFRKRGVPVTIEGLNEDSAGLMGKLALHDRPGARFSGH